MAALAEFNAEGFATRTAESRVVAVKSFSRWDWRDGRTADYDLKALAKPHDPSDRRRIRRVLSDTELQTLVERPRSAPPWRRVSAWDRSNLYAVAAMTGFRRSELRSLTHESFFINEVPAMVVCEAAYTKNGKMADQPVPAFLVTALRPWLATKPSRVPVFGNLPQRTGLMLATDLKWCGIASVDESKRVVDLHSLLHGYITSPAKAGTPIKTLQTLARHSDPKPTLIAYSHVSLFDTGRAVESLPDAFQPHSTPQILAATRIEADFAHRQMSHTDGQTIENPQNYGPESQPINEGFAHLLPTAGDGCSRMMSDIGGTPDSELSIGRGRKPLTGTGVGGKGRSKSGSVERVPS